jgi:hypothetical protein
LPLRRSRRIAGLRLIRTGRRRIRRSSNPTNPIRKPASQAPQILSPVPTRRNRPRQQHHQQIPSPGSSYRFVLQQVTHASVVRSFFPQPQKRRPANRLRNRFSRRRQRWRRHRRRFHSSWRRYRCRSGNPQLRPTHPAKTVLRKVLITALVTLNQHGLSIEYTARRHKLRTRNL